MKNKMYLVGDVITSFEKKIKEVLPTVMWVKTSAFEERPMTMNSVYTAVVSSIYKDKDGERVMTDVDLTEIVANPLLLFNHNMSSINTGFPIGKISEVGLSKEFLFARYFFDEQDEFAREVKAKLDRGYFKYSIGFMPTEIDSDDEGLIIKSHRLLEVSITIIPANDFTRTLPFDYMKSYYKFYHHMENKSSQKIVCDNINDIECKINELANTNIKYFVPYIKTAAKDVDIVEVFSQKKHEDSMFLIIDGETRLGLHHFKETDDAVYTNGELLKNAFVKSMKADLSAEDKLKCYKHLKAHFDDLNIETPIFKSTYETYELNNFLLGIDKVEENRYNIIKDVLQSELKSINRNIFMFNAELKKLSELYDKITDKIDNKIFDNIFKRSN